MACQVVKFGDGFAFVCGPKPRAKRCACGSGKPADLLCDWKTPGGPKPTCDAPICRVCTSVPAPDKDLCKTHAAEWAVRQGQTKR